MPNRYDRKPEPARDSRVRSRQGDVRRAGRCATWRRAPSIAGPSDSTPRARSCPAEGRRLDLADPWCPPCMPWSPRRGRDVRGLCFECSRRAPHDADESVAGAAPRRKGSIQNVTTRPACGHGRYSFDDAQDDEAMDIDRLPLLLHPLDVASAFTPERLRGRYAVSAGCRQKSCPRCACSTSMATCRTVSPPMGDRLPWSPGRVFTRRCEPSHWTVFRAASSRVPSGGPICCARGRTAVGGRCESKRGTDLRGPRVAHIAAPVDRRRRKGNPR